MGPWPVPLWTALVGETTGLASDATCAPHTVIIPIDNQPLGTRYNHQGEGRAGTGCSASSTHNYLLGLWEPTYIRTGNTPSLSHRPQPNRSDSHVQR